MYYQITASVGVTEGKSFIVKQVPTFYLHSAVQGIVSAEHAAEIAKTVCNPANDPRIAVNVLAVNLETR